MKAARAGVCCERGQVYSREIKMKYIGIERKPGFPMYAGFGYIGMVMNY